MDDLVSRLLEAIGETEREAPWTHHKSCASLPVEDDPVTYDCDCGVPASVLRRCAADRRVIERHARKTAWIDDEQDVPVCACCGTHYEYPVRWPCPTLIDIAESYGLSDHQEDEE